MILETERMSIAVCPTPSLLENFRRHRRDMLRERTRIVRVIITPEEECAILESLSPWGGMGFFDRPDRQQCRTLEGVPVEIVEPIRPPKFRSVLRGERIYPLPADPMETVRELWRTVDPYSWPEYRRIAPACRQCGQTADHFFTSQRDQTNLCATCFGEREAKQLAKDVTKSKHPLDAWMAE